MASLEIRSFRNEDNSVSMVVLVPPRRNGEPNFGAIARLNRDLIPFNPDAFDPLPSYEEQAVAHHAVEAPMPAHVAELLDRAESDDQQVGSLKAGEADGREHG